MKHAGKAFIVLVALCALCLFMMYQTATAHADSIVREPFVIFCASEEALHKTMPGEVRVLRGNNGADDKFGTTEVWIDKSNLNWSIVYRFASGKTCLISTGKKMMQTIEGSPA